MTSHAKIIRVLDDGSAEVVVRRSSACGHSCVGCNSCRANPTAIIVKAENPIHARCGDEVTLESSSRNVLGLAALLYLVPLLLFIAGYVAAELFGLYKPWDLIFGAVGFLVGIGLNFLQNKRLRTRSGVTYKIVDLGK